MKPVWVRRTLEGSLFPVRRSPLRNAWGGISNGTYGTHGTNVISTQLLRSGDGLQTAKTVNGERRTRNSEPLGRMKATVDGESEAV
jgi:hypothetical protein